MTPRRIFSDEVLEQHLHVCCTQLIITHNKDHVHISVGALAMMYHANIKRIYRALDSLCRKGYIARVIGGRLRFRFLPDGDQNYRVTVIKPKSRFDKSPDKTAGGV